MIGIFDSGVGGLTVLKEIQKELPEYPTIYFGDTARLPYGTKGAVFVKKYSKKITKWLVKNKAKVVVIACNTSSAWASDMLKKEFKIPIFEMITPAVEEAVKTTKNKKVGIIGTPGTIKSGIYQKKLSKAGLEAYPLACPLLVPFAEEGITEGELVEKIIKYYLEPLKDKGIDTLILGCTHYPLLKSAIEKAIDNNIAVVNPAERLSKDIKQYLEDHPIKKGKTRKFYFTDEPYNLEKISQICFGKKIKPVINDPL